VIIHVAALKKRRRANDVMLGSMICARAATRGCGVDSETFDEKTGPHGEDAAAGEAMAGIAGRKTASPFFRGKRRKRPFRLERNESGSSMRKTKKYTGYRGESSKVRNGPVRGRAKTGSTGAKSWVVRLEQLSAHKRLKAGEAG